MAGKNQRMLLNHKRFMDRLPSLVSAAERGNLEAQHDLRRSMPPMIYQG
jgi:hypothetical protein